MRVEAVLHVPRVGEKFTICGVARVWTVSRQHAPVHTGRRDAIMNRKTNFAVATLAAVVLVPTLGRAAAATPFDQIIAQLQTIATKVNQAVTGLNNLNARVSSLQTTLANVEATLSDVAENTGAGQVPFAVTNPGGLCDSAASPSSNPVIAISSADGAPFVVTSVLIKRGFMSPVDFSFLSLNGIALGGAFYDTHTRNLFFPGYAGETGVEHAADLLGTPVRTDSSLTDDGPTGGNVPHQLVIEAGDVAAIQLFCRSDAHDFSLEQIRVSGWKLATDEIFVDYTPGH